MKTRYIVIAFVLPLGVIAVQQRGLRLIRADRNVYRSNTEALMGENERYRTRDSLNVISVRSLELKIEEFERFRAGDAALISTLRADRNRLERVTTAQLQTIYDLQGTVRDSVIYVDNTPADTIRRIDISDEWFDLHGSIDGAGIFFGTFESRDSLLYVEHVEYKRFLGLLWRTRRIKARRQEIVPRNPHTTIVDAEFITIRK